MHEYISKKNNLRLLEYLEAFLSKGLIINQTSDPENTVKLKENSV